MTPCIYEMTNRTLPYTTYFRDSSASVITDNGAQLHKTDYRSLSPIRTAPRRVRSNMERNCRIAVILGNRV